MIEILEKPAAGPVIRLHEADNVVIARSNVEIGTKLGEGSDLPQPGAVRTQDRDARDHEGRAHPQVQRDDRLRREPISRPALRAFAQHGVPRVRPRLRVRARNTSRCNCSENRERATFMGIVRANGQVATRNYIGVLSTVNCSATVVHKIAEYFTPERLAEYPNVDGVVAFAHGTGCGMEMTGEPMDLLRRTIGGLCAAREYRRCAGRRAGLRAQPGQQTCSRSRAWKRIRACARSSCRTRAARAKTIAAGVAAVKEMLPEANRVTRTRVPASHIMVGLQCGGSDGFSSITANPALGAAMDILVRHGGTAILVGDAGNLRRRAHADAACAHARSRREAGRAHSLVEGRIHRRARHADQRQREPGQPDRRARQHIREVARLVDEGRHRAADGGLPLRRARQAATASCSWTRPDSIRARRPGQIAGGANVIMFTTGRGSMFGAKPVPSIKLATNTPMYNRLQDDMDINCGGILDGTKTMQQMGQRNFRRSAAHGIGRKDQERNPGSRRPRIRAVEYRRDRLTANRYHNKRQEH